MSGNLFVSEIRQLDDIMSTVSIEREKLTWDESEEHSEELERLYFGQVSKLDDIIDALWDIKEDLRNIQDSL